MKIEAQGTSIDIAPMMARRLRDLAKNANQNQHDIKEIGRQIHEIGGLDAMQEFYAFADLPRTHGIAVQSAWHGVGDWSY